MRRRVEPGRGVPGTLPGQIARGICLALFIGWAAFPRVASAQQATTSESLTQVVAGLDAALFGAYNACDMAALDRLVADDLEFFHDNDGLSVGKQVFLDSTRKNICGKVQRELVSGTLEVYPLGTYGALEVGVHRFHHPGAANDDPGEGKFAIIWQRRSTGWVMTRTISYAHRSVR